MGGGGVDGVIYCVVGLCLFQVIWFIGGIFIGIVVIIFVFDLECQGVKYVIYVVGLIWCGGQYGEVELLVGVYCESLCLGVENGCCLVVFFFISIGVYGYLLDCVVFIVLVIIQDFLRSYFDFLV